MTDNRLGTLHSHLHVRVPRQYRFPGLEPRIYPRLHAAVACRRREPALQRPRSRSPQWPFGRAYWALDMDVSRPFRIVVAGLVLAMMPLVCFAQERRPATILPAKRSLQSRRMALSISPLKSINAADKDYGQCLDEGRKMLARRDREERLLLVEPCCIRAAGVSVRHHYLSTSECKPAGSGRRRRRLHSTSTASRERTPRWRRPRSRNRGLMEALTALREIPRSVPNRHLQRRRTVPQSRPSAAKHPAYRRAK